MTEEKVIILDFGGQYKELIARRVRECGVYSEILPNTVAAEEIRRRAPIGIIFTGGPESVYEPGAPRCDGDILRLGIPILGICYGMHLVCQLCGGKVAPCGKSEYGLMDTALGAASGLFSDCSGTRRMLMSHADMVTEMPAGFTRTAVSALCPVAAMEDPSRALYCVQFHPEVENSERGIDIIRNFLYGICGAKGGYSMVNFLETQIDAVRERVGDRSVLLGLSGGVDSAVCAALLEKAVPGQLTCICVDHGLMRKDEIKQIRETFENKNMRFICVDASARFLQKLEGVTDPEAKRKIIGREFALVFEDEARKLGQIGFLAQGTIYPDVVESGTDAAVIKSHHNVGGLPKELGFEGVVEPLRHLFKDEVRALGTLLGLPDAIVQRQPFPGPGLAIRVIGEVTEEKLQILREADAILREEVGKAEVLPDQYFAVLTGIRSVGVMGDGRTYEYTLALRAVRTNDFMTCDFARLPWELLARVSVRITNEVKGVNRVVYDITSKPPATIEWE